jgi:hypothetical protein
VGGCLGKIHMILKGFCGADF